MLKILLTYFLIGLVEYIVDIKTSKFIYKPQHHIGLLLHHIFNIFLYFGWLTNNKDILKIIIYFPIITIIAWKINNDKCIFTELINKYYGNQKYFNDFINVIGLKKLKNFQFLYTTYLLIITAIMFHKIT